MKPFNDRRFIRTVVTLLLRRRLLRRGASEPSGHRRFDLCLWASCKERENREQNGVERSGGKWRETEVAIASVRWRWEPQCMFRGGGIVRTGRGSLARLRLPRRRDAPLPPHTPIRSVLRELQPRVGFLRTPPPPGTARDRPSRSAPAASPTIWRFASGATISCGASPVRSPTIGPGPADSSARSQMKRSSCPQSHHTRRPRTSIPRTFELENNGHVVHLGRRPRPRPPPPPSHGSLAGRYLQLCVP